MIARALAWLPLILLAAVAQTTESPTTVAPGAWLLEMDVVSVAYDRHTAQRDGWHFRSTGVGAVMLSSGVTARLDAQFGLDLWREERGHNAGVNERGRGRGDGWLRAKWNFAGDEAEGPAWALLPYVKLALADDAVGNGRTEPGLTLVHGRPLGESGGLNAMGGVDALDDGTGGRSLHWHGSVARTWDCGAGWACYIETMVAVEARATGQWTGEVGAGLTRITRHGVVWEVALYAGVTRSAPDWTPVLRLSWPL
jgi:hypothetical protein